MLSIVYTRLGDPSKELKRTNGSDLSAIIVEFVTMFLQGRISNILSGVHNHPCPIEASSQYGRDSCNVSFYTSHIADSKLLVGVARCLKHVDLETQFRSFVADMSQREYLMLTRTQHGHPFNTTTSASNCLVLHKDRRKSVWLSLIGPRKPDMNALDRMSIQELSDLAIRRLVEGMTDQDLCQFCMDYMSEPTVTITV